jgi:hypothetical protein
MSQPVEARHVTAPSQFAGHAAWTEASLRQAVEALQRQMSQRSGASGAVVEDIVRLGLQPDVLAALQQRRDPEEAIRDLATRHAFAAIMGQGRPFHALDGLSQALIQRTLDLIYRRADEVAERTGEDPLDEDAGLLLSLCESLSRYVPKKPMGAHISWKLHHYEGAVRRAMRQIEHLVGLPELAAALPGYILEAALPEVVKARLLSWLRGSDQAGLTCEAIVRFFALPATVEFVKRFAGTVQTARTLYAEEEYEGIAWHGPRRLPERRRQGYLEAALASLERRDEESLDSSGFDLHDLLGSR